MDENLIPQSPKIIYSSYNCDCKNCDSMAGNSCSNKPILKGYYEQKSPKYLKMYSHQSPRRSPNTPHQFIFDAVSPKEESSGKFNKTFLNFYKFFNNVLQALCDMVRIFGVFGIMSMWL